jgi:hypothetical protein
VLPRRQPSTGISSGIPVEKGISAAYHMRHLEDEWRADTIWGLGRKSLERLTQHWGVDTVGGLRLLWAELGVWGRLRSSLADHLALVLQKADAKANKLSPTAAAARYPTNKQRAVAIVRGWREEVAAAYFLKAHLFLSDAFLVSVLGSMSQRTDGPYLVAALREAVDAIEGRVGAGPMNTSASSSRDGV